MTKEEIINEIKPILEELSYSDAVSYLTQNDKKWLEETIKTLEQEPMLDKIEGYIDHIRNTGMGKTKSLEFIEKFIEGLKAESEDKEND